MKITKSPLEGLKVLELARVLAGPWAGQLLSDLGAEVIKVESPTGDETRNWGEDSVNNNSSYFKCTNRGKSSFVANFKNKSELKMVQFLAKKADVIIENYKVDDLKKYKLDYKSIKKINNSIIYCSITGFGQNGPLSSLPGYDFIIQAMAGIMNITGEENGPPIKPGVAYADIFTSLYSVVAIQSALLSKARNESGSYIDMSLYDTQLAVLANQASSYLLNKKEPKRMGNIHPSIVPYQLFEVKNGDIVIACGNDQQFKSLCKAFNWNFAISEKFSTNKKRIKHRDQLINKLSNKLKKYTKEKIINTLQNANVPVGTVNSVSEALNHRQTKSRKMIKSINGEKFLRTPISFNNFKLNHKKLAPELGESNKQIKKNILLNKIWEE